MDNDDYDTSFVGPAPYTPEDDKERTVKHYDPKAIEMIWTTNEGRTICLEPMSPVAFEFVDTHTGEPMRSSAMQEFHDKTAKEVLADMDDAANELTAIADKDLGPLSDKYADAIYGRAMEDDDDIAKLSARIGVPASMYSTLNDRMNASILAMSKPNPWASFQGSLDKAARAMRTVKMVIGRTLAPKLTCVVEDLYRWLGMRKADGRPRRKRLRKKIAKSRGWIGSARWR